MTVIKPYIIFVILVLVKTSAADVVYLKGDRNLYGQVMAIHQDEIIIEIISLQDNALEIQTFPISPVLKIEDESGIILYENGQARFKNLNPYYSRMTNNWEELKQKILHLQKHVITLPNLEKEEVHIVDITADFIFMEEDEHDSEKITVNKIALANILAINDIEVRHTNFDIAKRLLLSETRYPLYQVQVGYDYIQSHYSQLQGLFQDFYDQNNLGTQAAKRLDAYPGIFLKFDMYLKPYLSLGLGLHYYAGEKINELTLTMIDIKYVYRTSLLHPWISLGYAGQQFASTESSNGLQYEWLNTANTLSFGGGINSGRELGLGFNFSVYYMPFGEGKTRIRAGNLDETSSATIDFSLIKISLGMHYSFN